MGSGKRASMREGPLAALFRKTETEGLEERPAAAQQPRDAQPPAEPPPAATEAAEAADAPRTPTPQERLRHAVSSDLPALPPIEVLSPDGSGLPATTRGEVASDV